MIDCLLIDSFLGINMLGMVAIYKVLIQLTLIYPSVPQWCNGQHVTTNPLAQVWPRMGIVGAQITQLFILPNSWLINEYLDKTWGR